MSENEFMIKAIGINLYGMVDEDLIDKFWLNKLLNNILEYDDFVKGVDKVVGSNIYSKETLSERREELSYLLHNTMRSLIVVNLALKFLSSLADFGANKVLDPFWNDRLNEFKGFGV